MDNEMITWELKTNPALQRLVQPMDESSKASLKDSLAREPSSRTIEAWNGYVLGEGEKYELCKSLGLPVQVDDKSFLSFDRVAADLCESQLERTDLTGEYRKYLIGQLFLYEDMKGRTSGPERGGSKYRTAHLIGEKLFLADGTVMKYGTYASSMDVIFDQSTEFAIRILLGKTKVSHENVIELSRLAPEELKNVARAAIEENMVHLTFSDIRHEVKYAYTQPKSHAARRERKEQKEKICAGIRKMPAYDPDAEVNSLGMTMHSWVSSMERVNRNTDFSIISNRATLELMKQLTILERTISMLQKSLVERAEK